jgi:hypothetical protein
MLDWPLRTLLVTALVAGPYLGVARVTGFDRALRFSLRRAGVGSAVVAGVSALWVAVVVAVPQLAATTGSGFRLYVVGAVAFGLGLVIAGYAAHSLPRYYAVRAGTPAAAGDAAGRVTVRGTATPTDGSTTAPVSGRDCLVCETRTEGRIRRPKLSAEFWAATAATVDAVPFAVADDSGRLRVDPDGARLAVDADDANEGVADGAGAGAGAGAIGPRARRVEHRIEAGDEVVVVGRVREDTDGERVLDARAGATVLGDDGTDVVAPLRRAVLVGGPVGLALVAGGLFAMLVAVGVV